MKQKNTTISNKKIKAALVLIFIAVNPLTVHSQDNSRIINGYTVLDGEHPAMAAIRVAGTFNQRGGGTLVHPNWVLTAAHVVYDQTNLEIILGSTDYFSEEVETIPIGINEIFVHPFYDPDNNVSVTGQQPYDLALIYLSTPSSQTPMTLIDYIIGDGENVTVMGWGGTTMVDPPLPENLLNAADIQIVDCFNNGYGNTTDYEICAGSTTSDGYSGAWLGDSGGPLFLQQNNFDVLVGVVSWGALDASITASVYIDVFDFTDWIYLESDGELETGFYWGCMDEDADNYDINATMDDGSCEYSVVNITFANRDESGNNLYGTLEVDGVYPSINSEQVKEVKYDINHTIRTHHEYRSNDTKKHHRWNAIYDEFKMVHNRTFYETDEGDNDIATFKDIYPIVFDNNLSLIPAEIDIQDPWFRDTNGIQQGNEWVDVTGQYEVFLDQQPNQGQFYSIRTPQLAGVTQDNIIGFVEWRAYEPDGVTQDINENYVYISDPTNFNYCTVVFKQLGAVIKAEYGFVNQLSNYTLTIEENETLTIPPGAEITFADNFTININGGAIDIQGAKLTGSIDNNGIPTALMDIDRFSITDIENSIITNFALGFERHRQFAYNPLNLNKTVFDNVYMQIYGTADNYPLGINLIDINNCTWNNSFLATNLTGNNTHPLEWPLNLANTIFYQCQVNLDNYWVNVLNNYNLFFDSDYNIEINNTCIIEEDPNFVDLQNGNYNLAYGSPAIDAGDPISQYDPDGTITDIGAYYYQLSNSELFIEGEVGDNPSFYWEHMVIPDYSHYEIWRYYTTFGEDAALMAQVADDTWTDTDYIISQIDEEPDGRRKYKVEPIEEGEGYHQRVNYQVRSRDVNQHHSPLSNQVHTYRWIEGNPIHKTPAEPEIPDHYVLNNAYPNPFNPVTTIKYDLPEQSQVQLTIFDLLGRKINTLKSQIEDAGYYSIKWDGTDENGNSLSSGIYIINISVQSLESKVMFTQSQKVLLLK